MMKKMKKAAALAVVGGALLQFGGCSLGSLLNPGRLIQTVVPYAALEFFLDNDASPLGLDVFQD